MIYNVLTYYIYNIGICLCAHAQNNYFVILQSVFNNSLKINACFHFCPFFNLCFYIFIHISLIFWKQACTPA